MAKTIGKFSKEAPGICSASKIVKSWNVKLHEDAIARIRIFLVDNSFIDIYYNSETEKTSFAWIRNNKRVYGADNLGCWHVHPVENPEQHIKSTEMNFKTFLSTVEKRIKNHVK